MPITFDEISLTYWDSHKKKVGSSKSYSCYRIAEVLKNL